MDEKYQNKYRIQSARLQNWDYGSNASYFITICTKNRDHFFGEIRNNEMHLTNTGWLAETYWLKIPTHFPFIELGNFTVMPNHVHGILIMDKQENQTGNNNSNDKSPGQLRFQNQGNETISFIVGSYKSIVSKKGHISNPTFDWQSRFHDHIIRDADSFERIQQYITTNPLNWKNDKFYSE